MSIPTLIVDDEQECREIMASFLHQYCPQVNLIGQAGSVAEARLLIDQFHPQLIFLDVDMPGENGFQLFSHFPRPAFHTIFVTAYDVYAIEAFKYHATAYLLKPLNIEELIRAVTHVGQMLQQDQYAEISSLLASWNRPKQLQKIALPVMDGLAYIEASEIVRCEAKGAYTYAFLNNGKKMVLSKNLGAYESLLEPYGFARVHYHHLVNVQHIQKYINGRGGTILMSDQSEIQVSQRRREYILELLKG